MKNLVQSCIILILLTNCYQPLFIDPLEENLIIPTPSHALNVRVYWYSDSVTAPQNAVLVNNFEFQTNPYITQTVLADTLKKLSQSFGYDAIFIGQPATQNISIPNNEFPFLNDNDVSNPLFENYTSKVYKILAYKYWRNIDYADQLIYQRKTSSSDIKGGANQYLEEKYLPSGELFSKNGNINIANTIQGYSLEYLIFDQDDNWLFKWKNKNTLLRSNEHFKTTTTFSNGLPIEIQVKSLLWNKQKYQISIIYDTRGLVKEKIILKNGDKHGYAKIFYDINGRVIREELNLSQENKKLISYYTYYSSMKLKEILSKYSIANM